MSNSFVEDNLPFRKRRRIGGPIGAPPIPIANAVVATQNDFACSSGFHAHYYSNGFWYKGTAKEDRLVPEPNESLKRQNIIKAWIMRNCGRFPSIGTIASQLRYRPGILGPNHTVEGAVRELCDEGLLRREGGRVVSLVSAIERPKPTAKWKPAGAAQIITMQKGKAVMVGGLYAIDRIIGHGVRTNDNAVYYLVKWLGQPASEATWESEESLMVTAGPVILHYRKSLMNAADGNTS
uniref:Chromo domain-containing protein n=1 Tax=Eutreptiella gymnastica TaxID=73025 RepID=A0A7S4FUS6_9EUGL|mmetsp:Transcript_14387/g.26033  ORF Transcript_14387/g.26033 Transcript_14387/m.26033 type:complete len:237 (+) Transcript_14387:35-745(+)|eukprot:CAMPEP_0174315328 /NCGR_PEP_ID=MMETSP0810-20121108/6217_1 /TAXON_ID=73025 ORGANISM="Eutreptiella gymnastica-like, Strain CCMP1594" /NCGR_SAMPLE_ID=MMETSP0810 /ASSEMBLY_ACC=CAM_ASM_000659 /LENGTH=236 /DNA_ID=CAMNT_0015424685 /DNA_START=34 /DNA_END=744 /DNA_ORIENTATION=-